MDTNFLKKGISLGLGFSLCVLVVAGGSMLIADALHVFTANQLVSASQINANFNKLPPVGSIQAWHKALGGVPGLPDGWVQCDGQVLNDSQSPLNGQTIPNLNAARNAWNSKGSFLRGSSTSGVFEDDAFQGHRHAHNGQQTGGGAFILGFAGNIGIGGSSGFLVQDPITDTVNGTPRFGMETRSVNMSVVWIMRVK